jgi:hypothetical protein
MTTKKRQRTRRVDQIKRWFLAVTILLVIVSMLIADLSYIFM